MQVQKDTDSALEIMKQFSMLREKQVRWAVEDLRDSCRRGWMVWYKESPDGDQLYTTFESGERKELYQFLDEGALAGWSMYVEAQLS
jgi:hypothetical protein